MVLDVGTRDVHARGAANVKSIGIVAKLISVTGRVVHGHVDDVEVLGTVDAHELNWSVLDVETGDGGVLERVCVKCLGLGFSTIGT